MIKQRLILFLMVTGLMAACSGNAEPTPTITIAPTTIPVTPTLPLSTPTGETVRGQAHVDSIQILTLESFPVQINVRIRGELPDGCTVVDGIITQHTGNTFNSVVGTIRPGDAICTTATVPFEEMVSLDVLGLDSGTYTVTANGISGSFTLEVDNRLEPDATPTLEPTATPTPPPPDTAVITGQLWHDLCAIAGGIGEVEAEPSAGCIASPGGGFQANGLLEAGEPGIAGVRVSLGAGACPRDGLDTTTTDSNGNYTFGNLAPGTYCVSIDALATTNSPILLPGSFTAPTGNTTATTVSVTAGQVATAVNFGWDYEFLPLPEVDRTTCTNSVQFVDDITLPDNSVIAPGAEFVKTWRLRNNGTCPWIEGYRIVAVDNEPLDGEEEVAVNVPVATNQTVEISVSLTAPTEPGTYRSNWQMLDENDILFGVNGFLEDAFWLQIVVSDILPTAVPGSGSIGGIVWSDFCTILANGNPSANCIEVATGIYIGNGTLNNNEVGIANIIVGLGDGACPDSGVVTGSDLIATTTTDADGRYTFTNLEGGTYCIFIDAFNTNNLDLLIPGDWTYPARGTGRLGIILAAGEERSNVDFGWDHADD